MKVPDVRFTANEIIALQMLRSQIKLLKGTGLDAFVETALLKLAIFMPEKIRQRLDRFENLFLPAAKHTKSYESKYEEIETLAQAILMKRRCRMDYIRFYDYQEKKYTVDPLYFFEHRGGLYLFVRNVETGEIRSLEIKRVSRVKHTGESFEYPKDFDPQARHQGERCG